MKNMLRKIFNLSDIKNSWLLIISMIIFLFSLHTEKIKSANMPLYALAILSAVIWGILNYINHIKVNANYKKFDDIETYVDNLVISKDEKLELKSYLEDFAADLISQGKTKAEAVQIVINQFRVQEFSSLSKNNSILNLPIHYYLLGYVFVDIALILILECLRITILTSSFWLSAIEFMLTTYGVGLIGLFFLYKMFDAVISKKLNE
jgi:hypothetical protein